VPGVYARAFMLGRLTEEQMDNFRQEVGGKGISSYPHPWLMPDFWQFPTVSMGLGPLCAIYQARFMKYIASRGMIDAAAPSSARSGPSSATARPTRSSRWAPSAWPAARSSTT
jgi:pyruvate dehydrogenase complex dehydrogenase (E1) component